MVKALRTQQTSFTSGEVAPQIDARIEISRYYSGARLARNVLMRPTGGLKRRPGMRHRLDLGFNDGIRLIEFAFNVEQTYCFVITNGEFRVFRSDGVFLASGAAPYSGAQAPQVNSTQSGDTLLLFHADIAPQRIVRGVTEAIWTIGAIPLTNIPNFDYGAGAEPVISATRGWPECGTFHQARLWMGGFRSRPLSFIGSRISDFFNFNLGTSLDDDGIFATIDSGRQDGIRQMVSGRALQIFTAGAEHTITGTPITPTAIVREQQTRNGIKRYVRTVEVDGVELYVQEGGAALQQFLFSDAEQAWRSDLASLLAPHLILSPVDMAVRKSAQQDDANHVMLVNAAGTVSVLTTLRAQEVTGFTRWETDGQIRAVASLGQGVVFFAVLRAGTLRIETWDATLRLDAAVGTTFGSPATVLTGLTHLNGRTVTLLGDRSFLGTAVVAAGQVTFPVPVTAAEAGLANDLRIEPMHIEPRDQGGSMIGRKMRVRSVTARVNDTTLFEIKGQPMGLRRLGGAAVPDTSPSSGADDYAPQPQVGTPPPVLTGDLTLRGLIGWTERISLPITQTRPGDFELLALAYSLEVAS
jgi:hypothetical protein